MSDNLATESSPLNIDGAAAIFSAMLETPTEAPLLEEGKEPEAPEGVKEPEAEEELDTDPAAEPDDKEAKSFTIEVDGKEVTLTESEVADAYRSGMRHSDYTKKTMEAADQRKTADADIARARQERSTADAEIAMARQERNTFAQKNAETMAVLNAQLNEQKDINWEQLLNNDPVEFMRQKHLSEQRQAALHQARQNDQMLHQQAQAEQQANVQRFLSEQQEQLLAKLPEWKDAGKAKAEKAQLIAFLKDSGYSDEEIGSAADHRMVLIARDAMKMRDMMRKAKAAAKKVENVPQRVERSGNGNAPNIDKRSSAYQRLAKSGSVNDAAAYFSSIL